MTELKARYETEVSPITRRIHGLIAQTLGNTALLYETPEQAEFFVVTDNGNLNIRYTHGLELFSVMKADENGLGIGGQEVKICKYMVADIFTIRRLKAAAEVCR